MDSLSQKKLPPIPLELFRQLPKAELHCHLDGSVRIETIIELAKEQGVELPSTDVEELRSLVTVGRDCASLVEYLRGFGITLSVLQRDFAITRVMYEVAQDAAADGVRYLEVRFSPVLHTEGGMGLSQVMRAVVEGQVMAELNLPITVRIIVCGMRQLSPDVTRRLAEICWRYSQQGVIAFDLAGPEDGFSSELHRAAFDVLRENCVNCTLHSGEAAGWESVRDSIRYCGAQRIGHGVAIEQNPALLQYVVDRRIAVEVCLTSNLQTKAIPSLEVHPLRRFFDQGMNCVLCTDNVTVSGVRLSEEYHLAQTAFGFAPEEMLRLIDTGFRCSFLSYHLRERIRTEAIMKCLLLFENAGYASSSFLLSTAHLGPRLTFPPIESLIDVKEPNFTPELLRRLPKTDLHCRLDGSLPLKLVWELLQEEKQNEFQSFEDVCHIVKPPDGFTENTRKTAKELFISLLQSRSTIKRAVLAILDDAICDGVRYLELMVSLSLHIRRGLTREQVLQTVLETVAEVNASTTKDIEVGVVVYIASDSKDHSEEVAMECAKLAVKYRDQGVCGFGLFGPDIQDLEVDSEFSFCPEVFRYLKDESFNISIAAGKEHPMTIITAIHDAGATRISGGFSALHAPRLMDYLATHGYPIEMGLTELSDSYTSKIQSFTNPMQLCLDAGLLPTFCTFDATLNRFSRIEQYERVLTHAQFTTSDWVKWLSIGFRKNFQPYGTRERMWAAFDRSIREILTQEGFTLLDHIPYIPRSMRAKVCFTHDASLSCFNKTTFE
mmetsp:Transcript_37227/g.93455  ORF Transcript_37227/g.93455 Transcript_37227/m.93455 type:complete len:777 (-) Transcript_37227:4561-6891(-)